MRSALRSLGRDIALLAMIAFVLLGFSLPRLQAEASARALSDGTLLTFCHGDPAAPAGDPAQPPQAHGCDHCSACHLAGAPASQAPLSASRAWRHVRTASVPAEPLHDLRSDLPYATGPPARA